jgi:hypothetical protein
VIKHSLCQMPGNRRKKIASGVKAHLQEVGKDQIILLSLSAGKAMRCVEVLLHWCIQMGNVCTHSRNNNPGPYGISPSAPHSHLR